MVGVVYVNFAIKYKAILNIHNIDTFCALWSILAHFKLVQTDAHGKKGYKQYFLIFKKKVCILQMA